MKKFTSLTLIILTLSTTIFSQIESNQPKLIEEFGFIPTSHWFNFLYAIGVQLKDNQESNLLIKISGREGKNIIYPFTWGARMKAHFVGSMNFDERKIRVQNCDLFKEEIKVQFFLVPIGYIVSECNEDIPFPEKTFLLRNKYYENPYLPAEYRPEEIYGIPGADAAGSKAFYKVLNDLLSKLPDSKVLLIGYLGTNHYNGNRLNKKGEYVGYEFRRLDKPNHLKKMLKEVQDGLIKNGVNPSKISSVNGGYQDSTRNVEIWFVPQGGEVPKPKPDYFPKKNRKIKANKFNQT